MRNPMIDCMAKEWIEEFMFNGVDFTVGDVIDTLPLDHFELTDSEKEDFEEYVGFMADDLAELYDYVIDEDGNYIPCCSEDDECICDECRAKLAKERAKQEDEDTCTCEDEYTVVNTTNDKGLLTIPAKFVREIADSGEEMAYATFGDRVEVFPASDKKLMKAVKKEDDFVDVVMYNPHYTHGYFEVRRTMNGLITDLDDAGNTDFEINLVPDEGKIVIRQA